MWTGDPPANARGFQPFWQAKKAFIRVQNLCEYQFVIITLTFNFY